MLLPCLDFCKADPRQTTNTFWAFFFFGGRAGVTPGNVLGALQTRTELELCLSFAKQELLGLLLKIFSTFSFSSFLLLIQDSILGGGVEKRYQTPLVKWMSYCP